MLGATSTKMVMYSCWIRVLVLFSIVQLSFGRGRMVEPPQRSSLWRYEQWYGKPMVATNTDDEGLNCGGYWKLHEVNTHRCGLCGDAYDVKDRPNEAGGRFAQGYIVRTYHQSDRLINVTIDVKASIGGYFEFRICPNNDVAKRITQECLDKYPLVVSGHGYRFYADKDHVFDLQLKIPEDLTCTQCVLQWKWKGSYYWGLCDDGYGGIGCGDQEEYYNCADIAIIGPNTIDKATVVPPTAVTGSKVWHSDVTSERKSDVLATPAWGSAGSGLSTPSWLQDLLLVASEMGRPASIGNGHRKALSGIKGSVGIPVLNFEHTNLTNSVHNITTLHGSDKYPNVTYDTRRVHTNKSTVTQIDEKHGADYTIDNNTITPAVSAKSVTKVDTDILQKASVSSQNDVMTSIPVGGVPISNAFLNSKFDMNSQSRNALSWQSPTKPKTQIPWKDGGMGDKSIANTYWAVSDMARSDHYKNERVPEHQSVQNGNIVSTGILQIRVNSTSVGVTDGYTPTTPPSVTNPTMEPATTGRLFMPVASSDSDITSNTTSSPDVMASYSPYLPMSDHLFNQVSRQNIGTTVVPNFAKDFADVTPSTTVSSSLSPYDTVIANNTDFPPVNFTESSTLVPDGTNSTDAITTQTNDARPGMDAFAIDTSNIQFAGPNTFGPETLNIESFGSSTLGPDTANIQPFGPKTLGPDKANIEPFGLNTLDPHTATIEQFGPNTLGPDTANIEPFGPSTLGPDTANTEHFGPSTLGPDTATIEPFGPSTLGPDTANIELFGPSTLGPDTATTEHFGPSTLGPDTATIEPFGPNTLRLDTANIEPFGPSTLGPDTANTEHFGPSTLGPDTATIEPFGPSTLGPDTANIELFGPTTLGLDTANIEPFGPSTLGPDIANIEHFGPSMLGPDTATIEPFGPTTLGPDTANIELFGPSTLGPDTATIEPFGPTTLGPDTANIELFGPSTLGPDTATIEPFGPSSLGSDTATMIEPFGPTTLGPDTANIEPVGPSTLDRDTAKIPPVGPTTLSSDTANFQPVGPNTLDIDTANTHDFGQNAVGHGQDFGSIPSTVTSMPDTSTSTISYTTEGQWDGSVSVTAEMDTPSTGTTSFSQSNHSASYPLYTTQPSVTNITDIYYLDNTTSTHHQRTTQPSTSLPLQNASDVTPVNDNSTPTTSSVITNEVQLPIPQTSSSTDTSIGITVRAVFPASETSTLNPETQKPLDSPVRTDRDFHGEEVITKRDNPIISAVNDRRMMSLFSDFSGTANLQRILMGDMSRPGTLQDGSTGVRARDTLALDKNRRDLTRNVSGRDKAIATHTSSVFVSDNISPTAGDPIKFTNFVAANNHILSKLTAVNTSAAVPTSHTPLLETGVVPSMSRNDITFDPDRVLQRGSISVPDRDKSSARTGFGVRSQEPNAVPFSFSGQDIINAGRTVGIPLNQIRPGVGGIMSGGKQIISGLDFVDTGLQIESVNRTTSLSMAGNKRRALSRRRANTTQHKGMTSGHGRMTSENRKMLSDHRQMTSGHGSMMLDHSTMTSGQMSVAARQMSLHGPVDKVGGHAFMMHPPPPNVPNQLNVQSKSFVTNLVNTSRFWGKSKNSGVKRRRQV